MIHKKPGTLVARLFSYSVSKGILSADAVGDGVIIAVSKSAAAEVSAVKKLSL